MKRLIIHIVFFALLLPNKAQTITDIDNNVYNTVTIGTQVWMKENLKTTKFRDGSLIGTTTPTDLDISAESNPVYQWPAFGYEFFIAYYGRLYTWYAVTNNRGICPAGWHVPTDAEFDTLKNYLGYYAGGELKETDTIYWNNPNNGATNNSGFSALPAGVRDNLGQFFGIRASGWWWSSSEFEPDYTYALHWNLFYNSPYFTSDCHDKGYGQSVRCLKDNTTTLNNNCLKDIHIYPNPSKDILYLKSFIPIMHVSIFDLQGKLVYAMEGNDIRSINIQNLYPDIYILQSILIDGDITIDKILIE